MKKILFVGSFDPVTKAHIDIIKRLVKLDYEVHIGILSNAAKTYMFEKQQREEMIQICLKKENISNVEVFMDDGLLIDVCKKRNINLIARGLRNTLDFEYEKDMEYNNKLLQNNIEYIYLISDKKYMNISSSLIRELIKHNGEISDFLPKEVIDYIY